MLLTVERVAALRHVNLFAATPARVLAGLASVMEEVGFQKGEELMREGAVEDWLFVVIAGEVEVTRPDRKLRMSADCVVGELQVLDPQARSATVTAVTPVSALKLNKAAFDEALRTRPEIAAGVIAQLVGMLRESHEPPQP
jgi:CRP/FNR family transcriptional regulator, cyclic AMP receptor protein